MATTIKDLGKGIAFGYIYEVDSGGTISTYPNSKGNAKKVIAKAVGSKAIQQKYFLNHQAPPNFSENFYDETFGSRWYLNSDPAAPFADITGAIEITDYVIPSTKNRRANATINADAIDFVRKGEITIVELTPQASSFDELKQISWEGKEFVQDDIVILVLAEESHSVLVKNGAAGSQFNIKINGDRLLNGIGSCLALRVDEFIDADADSVLEPQFKEIWYNGNGADLDLEVKEVTDYTNPAIVINPTKKRTVVKLKAGTLVGNTTITIVESDPVTGFSKQGQMVWVQMKDALDLAGFSLTVVGQAIPVSEIDQAYTASPSLHVWAYYNPNNAAGVKYDSQLFFARQPDLLSVRKVISSADVLNGFITPINIIPAPAADEFIEIIRCSRSLIFNTTAYVAPTVEDVLIYDTATKEAWSFGTTLDATVSQIVHGTNTFGALYPPAVTDTVILPGVGVNWKTESVHSNGDSSLVVYVTYRKTKV